MILILAILSLYLLMAFLGAIITANNQWDSADSITLSNGPQNSNSDKPIDIFVETNGIHVSIILPLANDRGILSHKLQAAHMQNPQYHSQYAMIGWGHKGVYQNAENWNDLTVSDAASAIFGTGDALMHIYYVNRPTPNNFRKKISITPVEYLNILNNIAGYFKYDVDGKLRVYPGYGADNIFYAANGRYSAVNTCNSWAGRILREAGIKIGYWTPFSQSIMYRF